MARQRPDRVVLVDLHLQFGQVATHLNLEVKQSIADVARDEAAMREPELLRTYATRHDSGLHVLAAPTSPELAELVTAEHVDRILTTLLESYDSVVIDAGSWLDERTMTVFEHAETVIFAVCPEIGALKALHGLLDYLNEAGSVAAKSTFVLNNQFAREILKLRDVESALGTQVAIRAAVRPVPLPQGRQRGRPDRPRRAALHPGREVREARGDGVRPGRHQRPGGAGAQADQPVRRPDPALIGEDGRPRPARTGKRVRSRGTRRARSRTPRRAAIVARSWRRIADARNKPAPPATSNAGPILVSRLRTAPRTSPGTSPPSPSHSFE